jgi:hypothetical protein
MKIISTLAAVTLYASWWALSSHAEEESRYRISQTASCCQMIENSTELMACIDEIEPPKTTSESGTRIAI